MLSRKVWRQACPQVLTDTRASAQAKSLCILRETIDVRNYWLIVEDLSRCYLEIAQQEGWPELQWAAIGRELGKLTKKKTIKRHGKRHVAYLLR